MRTVMPLLLLAVLASGAVGCNRQPAGPASVPRGVEAPAPVQERPLADPDIYVVTDKQEGMRTRESREGGHDICIWHEIVSLKNTETQNVVRIEYPVLPYLDSRDELLNRSEPGDTLKVVLHETRHAREGIIDLHASRIDITQPPGSPPRQP